MCTDITEGQLPLPSLQMNIFLFLLSGYSHLEFLRDWNSVGWLEVEVWLRKDREFLQNFFGSMGGGRSGRPRRIWDH